MYYESMKLYNILPNEVKGCKKKIEQFKGKLKEYIKSNISLRISCVHSIRKIV